MNESLFYHDADGARRRIAGCGMRQDKAGRYWLWSDQLERNLAYQIRTREDCLLAAIDSLLYTLKLRDERIAKLQKIADLAEAFATAINPETQE